MSSSPSSDEEIVWTEQTKNDDGSDWISFIENTSKGTAKGTIGRDNQKVQQKQTQEKNEEIIRNARELNPYYRKGTSSADAEVQSLRNLMAKNEEKITVPTETKSNRMTDAERNAIYAKILKAEMLGNHDLVRQLKEKLETTQSEASFSNDKDTHDDVKVKYYSVKKPINEDMSLKEMFIREKTSTVADDTKMFVASCAKTALRPEDEYEDHEKAKKKRKIRDDHSNIKFIKTDDSGDCKECPKCIPRHLILSLNSHTFIALPSSEPLMYGHCSIQSVSHSNYCTLIVDEDCLREINQRKRELCQMFDSKGRSTIFTEIYFRKHKLGSHLKIDVYTVKKKYESDAKMYFKKAIMECEEEWSMNKKLIEMNGKCVTKMIPKGLSYFWVCFGPQNIGYGHVIENEEAFSRHFAIEILGGLLDIERRLWKKPKIQDYHSQYKRSAELKELRNKIIS